ncbi:MAG: hypothetical protein IPM91_17770 [Bacteroidetes bacterium]|nr:hypothetical protein [Bacteroidota bacterium]
MEAINSLLYWGDFDYWLVKMDLSGNFILENTLGGIQADNCYAMVPTGGGGALLAGYSNSPISFSKTEISRGGFDYWVVRVDSLGRRLWDKTIGGPVTILHLLLRNIPDLQEDFNWWRFFFRTGRREIARVQRWRRLLARLHGR